MVLTVLTTLSLLIWLYLLFFNGWFWLSDQKLEGVEQDTGAVWPEVVAVIPARNEAETIGAVVSSHMATDYSGAFSIIVVDDQSDDGTGDIVRSLAESRMAGSALRPVVVAEGKPLPEGWSGKLWAVHTGLQAAEETAPDAAYVLLTDADIVHAPETLRKLVAKAERETRALVSVMAHLDARGVCGSLLMPAFIFFFEKLYPFRSTNDPASKIAGAAGGCMLVKRDVLAEIGGVEAIRGNLIDDCALALKIKDPTRAKRSIWLGFDPGVVSLRDNQDLATIWKMVARTAFTQLRFSTLALVGAVVGMVVTYLVGPLAFLTLPLHGNGLAFTLGTWVWIFMMIAYAPTLFLYKKALYWALLLPVSACFYMAMTISSALNHWRGAGGAWKGRTYS
ncbi:MAG: glycosyltransferase [Pseudomonadota bacterium]